VRHVSGATASGLRDEGRLSKGVGLLRRVWVLAERTDLLLPALRDLPLPLLSPDSGALMMVAPQQSAASVRAPRAGGRHCGGRVARSARRALRRWPEARERFHSVLRRGATWARQKVPQALAPECGFRAGDRDSAELPKLFQSALRRPCR